MVADATPPPHAQGEANAGPVRIQLSAILASRHFVKAERLCRFLRFVVEKNLDGRGDQLKELVIGLEVFGRPAASYDPGIDPIVRVQAGRLRAKLAEYYEQEGAEDLLVIELPRGHYVPAFRTRPAAPHRSSSALRDAQSDVWNTNSVAVLPFVNMSSDPENEYFSDGLTEELIHALASVPSLHVAARTSTFQFKDKGRDIREIGRLLGVGKIVEGSVRKAEDRLRITVQLINVADGCHLWSEKYDRTISDVFALEDEIARAIRQALSGKLNETPQLRPTRRQTGSFDAFNHYLKGRFHWNKRNERGLRAAIDHFHEAIRVDAGYGRAYSGLADCYFMLGISAAEAPTICMPLARQAALRAVEIDDCLVEAHTSLAAVMTIFDWDRSGAEREFQRALELDRNYATLHQWLSLFSLAPERRFAEAADEAEWAEELDPVSLPIINSHALVQVLGGHYDAAIRQCSKVLSLDSNYSRTYWFLGLAHERLGDFRAATEVFEKALALDTGSAFRSRIQGALGRTHGRWGKPDRAIAILNEMEGLSKTAYVDQFEMAQICTGLGDMDGAMNRLERAAHERSSYLVYCNVWPGFETLRPNPRFGALLSRLSLVSSADHDQTKVTPATATA